MTKEAAWLLTEKHQGIQTPDFFSDCAKLDTGTPLAYLIGHIPFLNCTIHLDSHPLIPRPETEYWVEQAITAIKSQSSRRDLELGDGRGLASSLQVIDLCAGSGAIGVAVAKAVPEADVTFAELDTAHLPTIEKNIKQNTIIYDSKKYIIIGSDLFSALEKIQKYDFILTNPPYIDAEAHTVDDTVAEHEPHLALFGGDAGMEIITRIIAESPQYLTPTGKLWIEHEPAQVEAIATLAAQNNFTVITHPDQYGVPRFSVLTMAQ